MDGFARGFFAARVTPIPGKPCQTPDGRRTWEINANDERVLSMRAGPKDSRRAAAKSSVHDWTSDDTQLAARAMRRMGAFPVRRTRQPPVTCIGMRA